MVCDEYMDDEYMQMEMTGLNGLNGLDGMERVDTGIKENEWSVKKSEIVISVSWKSMAIQFSAGTFGTMAIWFFYGIWRKFGRRWFVFNDNKVIKWTQKLNKKKKCLDQENATQTEATQTENNCNCDQNDSFASIIEEFPTVDPIYVNVQSYVNDK